MQVTSMVNLRNNENIIILKADKNLGPAILERDVYIRRALDDHLLDKTSYRQMSETTTDNHIKATKNILSNFIDKYFPDKKHPDRIFLEHSAATVKDP